jgi:rod shape-determining protein MreD
MFNLKTLKWFLIFVFGFLFQDIIVNNLLSIKNVRFDFITIVLIFFGLEFGGVRATIVGFIVGLVQGLGFFSGGFIGLSSLTKSITGFYAGFFQRSKNKWNDLYFLLILFSGCLIHNIIYFYISTLGLESSIYYVFFRTILPSSIYTTIIGMMIFYSFKK